MVGEVDGETALEIYSLEIACGLSAWKEPTPCDKQGEAQKEPANEGQPREQRFSSHAHPRTQGKLAKSRTHKRPARTQSWERGDWARLQ